MQDKIKYLLIILGAAVILTILSLFVPIERSGTANPDLNVVEADISANYPLISFSGFVTKKGENYIYVRVGDGQDVPAGSLRNVLVERETKIQKTFPAETDKTGYVIGSKTNNISFNQIPLGTRVIVVSKDSTDILKEAVFTAESITVIEGEF